MKSKLLKSLACTLLVLVSVLCFAGCGGNQEENFKSAQNKFNNYTVNVSIEYIDDNSKYSTDLYVDGNYMKQVTSYGQGTYTYYLKEENSNMYYYDIEDGEWEFDSRITQECEEDNGYVQLFQKVFYDDFESDGNNLVMKDDALSAYGLILDLDILSVKLVLSGKQIKSAIAMVDNGIYRIQFTYSFSNYGKTKVVIPE